MVALVKVGPNPAFRPTKDQEAMWQQIKAEKPKMVSMVTAAENVKLSGGMYAILPESVAPAASAVLMPEEMSADALKLTALQLGVDLRKPMKKADLVAVVRKAMDAVQFVDDDSEGDET